MGQDSRNNLHSMHDVLEHLAMAACCWVPPSLQRSAQKKQLHLTSTSTSCQAEPTQKVHLVALPPPGAVCSSPQQRNQVVQ